jgi:carbonic anhydrase/acetyltransferase-like protein (isoleucine patch superfamily)
MARGKPTQQPAGTRRRAFIVRLLIPLYLAMIFGLATASAALPIAGARSLPWRIGAIVVAPFVFSIVMLIVAGCLSRLTRSSIVEGRYPRSLGHRIYGPRRLYAVCWTCLYYCSPVYHLMLAVPVLRHLTWRLFGYRGNLDFTIYPDTWIRDLPLVEIGEGAYVSNKATLSPNMCLKDGTIVIRPVVVGPRTLIGHLTMIAPGVTLGPDVEIGVGAGIGLRVQIGAGSIVGPCVVLDHGVRVGQNCIIGVRAYVGHGAVLADGIRIPEGAVIPPRSRLGTQRDVDLVLYRAPAMPNGSLSDGVRARAS